MTNQDAMLKSKHAEDKLSIHKIQNNNETAMVHNITVVPAAEANELATEAAIGPATEPTNEPAIDPAIGPIAGATIGPNLSMIVPNPSNIDDDVVPVKPEILKSSYSMPPTTKEGSGCFEFGNDDDDFTYIPPTILSKPSNQAINEGDTVELHCLVNKLGICIFFTHSKSTFLILVQKIVTYILYHYINHIIILKDKLSVDSNFNFRWFRTCVEERQLYYFHWNFPIQ